MSLWKLRVLMLHFIPRESPFCLKLVYMSISSEVAFAFGHLEQNMQSYSAKPISLCDNWSIQLFQANAPKAFITARKWSLGQGTIFAPVCHSVHGGAGTPPPPGRYTPPGQVHLPWEVHHPGRYPLPGRYTPWAGTPRQVHHPWQVQPPQVHPPRQVPPLAGTPPAGTHPGMYTPWAGTLPSPTDSQGAGSTHPTGMHSCLISLYNFRNRK